MKKILILCSLFLVSSVVEAQTKPTCPVTLAITSEDKTIPPHPLFATVVQQEFVEAFKRQFGDKLSIVGNNGDFLLKLQLRKKDAAILFEGALLKKGGASLSTSNHSYTEVALQTGLRGDAQKDFAKFSSILSPQLPSCKPLAGSTPPQNPPPTAGKLCLFFKGDIRVGMSEEGITASQNSKSSGKIPLSLNGNQIQGTGEMETSSSGSAMAPEGISGRSQTSTQKNPVSASGPLLNNVAELHVVAAGGDGGTIQGEVKGAEGRFAYSGATYQGVLDITVKIPFQAGAEKTETRTSQPVPGITRTDNYHFVMQACDSK